MNELSDTKCDTNKKKWLVVLDILVCVCGLDFNDSAKVQIISLPRRSRASFLLM